MNRYIDLTANASILIVQALLSEVDNIVGYFIFTSLHKKSPSKNYQTGF